MISSRSLAIARTGFRLLIRDPAPVVVTILMPLVMTAFLMPAMRTQLRAEGFQQATGSEQVVPGMAVTFAFASTQLVGTLFFREHAWGTWDRLRASPASTLDVVLGKVGPLYLCLLTQVGVTFLSGAALFGYRVNGSVAALCVVLIAFVAMLVAFGVMLVAVFPTMDQALVLGNLGGMVMAGLGGALAPASTMPGWAQAVAHATPAYWTLRAVRDITLTRAGLGDVAGPLLALLGFLLAFVVVATLRFRPSDVKVGTT